MTPGRTSSKRIPTSRSLPPAPARFPLPLAEPTPLGTTGPSLRVRPLPPFHPLGSSLAARQPSWGPGEEVVTCSECLAPRTLEGTGLLLALSRVALGCALGPEGPRCPPLAAHPLARAPRPWARPSRPRPAHPRLALLALLALLADLYPCGRLRASCPRSARPLGISMDWVEGWPAVGFQSLFPQVRPGS